MIELPGPFKPYAKAVTALAVGVLGWGTQVVNSTPAAITASEWIGLGTAVLAALGVAAVTNKTSP